VKQVGERERDDELLVGNGLRRYGKTALTLFVLDDWR